MAKFFDTIRNMIAGSAASSTQIRDAIAQVDIADAERAVVARQAERRAILVAGSGAEIEKAGAAVRAAEVEVERRHAIVEALQNKLLETEARELVAEVEARGKRAAELAADMQAMYATIDQAAAELAAHLAALTSARADLRACNAFTTEHGRPDLKASDPVGLLAQQLGRPVDSVATFGGWRFDPYWPAQPGAAPLAKIVELAAVGRKAA